MIKSITKILKRSFQCCLPSGILNLIDEYSWLKIANENETIKILDLKDLNKVRDILKSNLI